MEAFLLDHGPLAVFVLLLLSGVGLPLGEDLIIIPAGALMATGRMPIAETILAAYAGTILADFIWFGICWHYGKPLLHRKRFKRFLHPRRLLEFKHQIEERGVWVVVMARFIPGSRSPAITVAGMLHLPFWKFALAEVFCVMITAPLQLTIGWVAAQQMEQASVLELIVRVLGVVMLMFALVMGLQWWRSTWKKGHRAPRAKMAWLRRRPWRPRKPANKQFDANEVKTSRTRLTTSEAIEAFEASDPSVDPPRETARSH